MDLVTIAALIAPVSEWPALALAWTEAHPAWTLWILSAVLSVVPTTYKFKIERIGLSIPIGLIAHLGIGNLLQVARKNSPATAAMVEKYLPIAAPATPPAEPPKAQ